MLHSWKTIEEDEDKRNHNKRINWVGRIKIIAKGLGFLMEMISSFWEEQEYVSTWYQCYAYVLCFSSFNF